MEDLLWSITQESRVLRELRKEIRGVWDDEASRELSSRFLDPHESEDQQMLASLAQQKDFLEKSQTKLQSSKTYAQQAEENAQVVVESLKSITQEESSIYSYHDTFAHYDSEARAIFPIVRRLINQANNACSEQKG